MNTSAREAYAVTRLHARYAALVYGPEWRRLQRAGPFGGFVQQARETALSPWLLQVDPAVDVHVLEASLRAGYRRQLREVAGWLPLPWRAAVRWLEQLQVLPELRHRAASGAAYPWLAEPAAPSSGAGRDDGARLLREWQTHWLALWPPRRTADETAGLQRLGRLWQALMSNAQALDTAPEQLEAALRRIFRRHRAAAVLAFAYLSLLWLQVLRLRGALLRRRLLDPTLAAAVA